MNFSSTSAGFISNTMNKTLDFGLAQAANERNTQRYFDFEEKAAQNAYKRLKELITTFQTPEAQLRMLKDAGLSPSLMYGGLQGVSGMSAPMGGGAPNQESGLNPSTFDILGAQKTAAEIKNIEADTKSKEANTKGQENQNKLFDATFMDVVKGTKMEANLKEAQQAMAFMQNEQISQNWEDYINAFKYQCKIYEYNCYKANYEATITENQLEISDATKNEQIEIIKNEAKSTFWEALNKLEENKKLKVEIQKIVDETFNMNFENSKDAHEWLIKTLKEAGCDEQEAKALTEAGTNLLQGSKDLIELVKTLKGKDIKNKVKNPYKKTK